MINQQKAEELKTSPIPIRFGIEHKIVRRYLLFDRDDAGIAPYKAIQPRSPPSASAAHCLSAVSSTNLANSQHFLAQIYYPYLGLPLWLFV